MTDRRPPSRTRKLASKSSTARRPVAKSAVLAATSPFGRAVVVAIAVLWTIPIFGILVSSFRPEIDVKTSGWWEFFLDPSFTLDSYRSALSAGPGQDDLSRFILNSFRITIPSVLLSVGIGLLAAYALSWIKFKGRDWIFLGIVGLLIVPLQMALIPLLQLFAGLNIAGEVYVVWFAHTAFGLPFVVYVLRNFVAGLPQELIEAARVDGASHAKIFARLIVPLAVPAIAAVSIFQFMWIWNDYLIALIFAGRENAPVTAQLATLTGTRGQSYHLLTAAGVLSMIVPTAVFFGLQRYFVRGLLAGAVKE